MTAPQAEAETEPASANIRVYNTLTRRKEPLQTIEPGTVRMYVYGQFAEHLGTGIFESGPTHRPP